MNDDAEAVRAAVSALDEAFERFDLNAVMELCTKDVVFIGSGDGEEAVGRDEIGAMFARLAPQLASTEFSPGRWESVDIEVLGDVALVVASRPATLVTPSRTLNFRYRLTGVLVQEDTRWLWRVYHGSEPGAW